MKQTSTYGKAKLLATNYLLKLFREFNFPVTILRLYLSYGPRQDINRFLPILAAGCISMPVRKRDNCEIILAGIFKLSPQIKLATRWKKTAFTPGYVSSTKSNEVAAGSRDFIDSKYFFSCSNMSLYTRNGDYIL